MGLTTRGSCHLCCLSALGSCFIRNSPFLSYMCGSTALSACLRGSTLLMDASVSKIPCLHISCWVFSQLWTVCPVDTQCIHRLQSPTGVSCLPGLGTCPLLVCLRHTVVSMLAVYEDSCLKTPTQIPLLPSDWNKRHKELHPGPGFQPPLELDLVFPQPLEC